MIDIISLAARRKLGATNKWHWANSEAITGGLLVKGSETSIGKSGKTIWAKPLISVLITREDLDNEKKIYEKDTGKCFSCQGTGEETYGHSVVTGPMKRPCKKCGSTGKPK